MVPYKSYKLNAQLNCNINIDRKPKVKGYWWDALGLALLRKKVSILAV
jgi:Zn-finger nucleic acid-binding protein